MFELCIVGHGNFPSGVCSALKLLSGSNEHLHYFDLDHNLTHNEYKMQLTEFLSKYDDVLIFADLTGGAPHQIATKLILDLGKENQFIMSSVSLNLILDLYMKNSMSVITDLTIRKELFGSITESKEMLMIVPEIGEQLVDTSNLIQEEGI